MNIPWFQWYLLFALAVATVLAPWYYSRMKTVKVRGQEFNVAALPYSLKFLVKLVTLIAVMVIAPLAIVEYVRTTWKEKKHGKLGK